MNDEEKALVRAVDAEKALLKAEQRIRGLIMEAEAFGDATDTLFHAIAEDDRRATMAAVQKCIDWGVDLQCQLNLNILDPVWNSDKETRDMLEKIKGRRKASPEYSKLFHELGMKALTKCREEWMQNVEQYERDHPNKEKEDVTKKFLTRCATCFSKDLTGENTEVEVRCVTQEVPSTKSEVLRTKKLH